MPPDLLFSTSKVFAPYQPDALLAAPLPPLPPPITMKSYSFGVGAMILDVAESCREKDWRREAASGGTEVLVSDLCTLNSRSIAQ